MKILAFDQSTRISGWSVFDDEEYVDSGVIDLSKIKDTTERTNQMGLAIGTLIADVKPDMVVIEETQCQSNVDTVKKLSRIQGMAMGFAAALGITVRILEPSKWRSALNFHQGPKVERKELKKQSLDYVKGHFGFEDFSEDRCEAININVAAQKIFGWDE